MVQQICDDSNKKGKEKIAVAFGPKWKLKIAKKNGKNNIFK